MKLRETMDWGSVSDWFSAGCNLVMASVAVYAAMNAKDWLSPKLNERKFKFADEVIDDFCKLQQEALYLHSDVKQLINTDPAEQGGAENFKKYWSSFYNRDSIYRRNTINLNTKMERMVLWGLKPKNKKEFDNVINLHLKLSYTISDALAVGAEDVGLRLKNCVEYGRHISMKYKAVRVAHNNIIDHYNNLFIS
jgi:hypothetical protein